MKKNINRISNTRLSYVIHTPLIKDEGYLSFAEENEQMPFKIKRFYYIFDVVKDAKRGFHAHRKTKQVLFCIKGSIKVILDNGTNREEVLLNKANQGIFLNKMIWHEMLEFTKDTVLLVAASEKYNEADYIRDYEQFLRIAKQEQNSLNMYFLNIFNLINKLQIDGIKLLIKNLIRNLKIFALRTNKI